MRARIFVTCLFLASLIFPQQISAKLTGEELSKVVSEAKILPADAKISLSVSAEQAQLSTYVLASSSDPIKDCKIEAILLAKTIFSADDSLTRLTARFYDRQWVNYYEINVSIGDVKAYGSGQLSSEKLLSSLELKFVSTEERAQTKTEPKSISTPDIPQQSDRIVNCGDLAFNIPNEWTNKEKGKAVGAGKGEQVIAKLMKLEAEFPAVITVSRFARQAPSKMLLTDANGLRNNHFVNVKSSSKLAGTNKSLKLLVLEGYNDTSIAKMAVERVFLETHSYLYTMTLTCAAKEKAQLDLDFSTLLFSIHAPSSKNK
jgi:hypothetical protein